MLFMKALEIVQISETEGTIILSKTPHLIKYEVITLYIVTYNFDGYG